MTGVGLGKAGIASLATALGNLPQLRGLSVGSNNLGPTGTATLAAALKGLEQLQVRTWLQQVWT